MHDPQGRPFTNPYAAPVAASMAVPVEKDRRVNLINRRTSALLLEYAVWTLTVGTLSKVVLVRALGPASAGLAGILANAPFFLVRDLVGNASPGKRMFGLTLVAEHGPNAGRTPTPGARVLRNLPLVVPLLPVIEYLVAFYGDAEMRRLGDKMGSCHVVDVDPERYGRGSYSATLLGALVLAGVASFVGGLLLAPLVVGTH